MLEKVDIKLDVDVRTPEEAIELSGRLLVDSGKITEKYVTKMIETFSNLGSYIVIAPGIAIPHSQSEEGEVLKDCFSFVRLKEPIPFGHPSNDPVRFVIPIAGTGQKMHIDLLRKLSTVLSEESNIKVFTDTDNPTVIFDIFNQK